MSEQQKTLTAKITVDKKFVFEAVAEKMLRQYSINVKPENMTATFEGYHDEEEFSGVEANIEVPPKDAEEEKA